MLCVARNYKKYGSFSSLPWLRKNGYNIKISVMEKYDRITNARKILGLHETETLTCIKNKYKKLIKAFHPDVCEMDPAESKRKTEQLNDAYKVILEYCNNYQYSFTREEVEKHLSPEEFWRNHFGNDPLWGNTMKNKE